MTELTREEIELVHGGAIDFTGFFSTLSSLVSGTAALLNKVGPLLNATSTFFTALGNFFKP
jgi:hypothetical protein